MVLLQLEGAIQAVLREKGLQHVSHTVTKVVQLYETKNSRHSTMIVGATQSGKTVSWRVLQAALSKLCKDGDPNFNVVRVSGSIPLSSVRFGKTETTNK